ncbi:MAG: VapC toxin family PIN domain ribonuclease [Microbacterium sp.]|nr:MAG: VapC toxin family PIN domain ribonuclease [Microbacterium sp.]
MTAYLLDTNVVSELIKATPSPTVAAWLMGEPETWLSVLTIGELRRGAHLLRRRDETRAARLDEWITQLAASYGDRILPVDARVTHAWAALPATRTLPVIDALIAATARVHGLTVATRNVSDFADTSVSVVDPF